MILFLTFTSALMAIAGNITAKYWADRDTTLWLFITIILYIISTVAYAVALRVGGKYTIVNSLFYTAVPILTVLSGILLFKDRLTLLQSIGLLLSFAGIILFTVEQKWKN